MPKTSIQEWVKLEDDLKIQFYKGRDSCRLPRLYYSGKWPVLDNMLYMFIKDKRANKRSVRVRKVKRQSKAFAIELGIEYFVASPGFIANFMRRKRIVRRKITHVAQIDTRPLEQQQETILNFFGLVDRCLYKYLKPAVLNMDETGVWFDMPRSSTLDEIGAKTIVLNMSGYEKLRFSVVLTIASNGQKLD